MRWRAIGWSVLVAALAGVGWFTWRASAWLRTPGPLVAARDTTYLTGPLNSDGTVDYAAAWRDERSKGITPENNAAPIVFAALDEDLSAFTEAERAGVPKFEGEMPELQVEIAEDGESEAPSIDRDQALAIGDDSTREVREIRVWIERMSGRLDAAKAALERPRFHASSEGPRFDVEPAKGVDRRGAREFLPALGRSFRWRALMSAAKGEIAKACTDLRAALRLARLEGDLEDVGHLDNSGADELAAWTATLLAARSHVGIAPGEFRTIIDAVDPSPARARLRRMLRAQRLRFLGALDADARDAKREGHLRRADPNNVHRRANEWFDRFEQALLEERPWSASLQGFDDVCLDLDLAGRQEAQKFNLFGFLLRGPDAEASLVVAVHVIFSMIDFETRSLRPLVDSECTIVELALLAFQHATGGDPQTSEEFTPLLFDQPFRDRVTGSAVRFQRDDAGELVMEGPLVELRDVLHARAQRSETR